MRFFAIQTSQRPLSIGGCSSNLFLSSLCVSLFGCMPDIYTLLSQTFQIQFVVYEAFIGASIHSSIESKWRCLRARETREKQAMSSPSRFWTQFASVFVSIKRNERIVYWILETPSTLNWYSYCIVASIQIKPINLPLILLAVSKGYDELNNSYTHTHTSACNK